MQSIEQIQSIFRDIFDDPKLTILPSTSQDDIADWDSVGQVRIVLALEEAFGIRFTTSDVAGFHSVGDFIQALERRSGKPA